MPDLIKSNNEATAWMEEAVAAHSGGPVFGRVASSVIWSDAKDADGNLLVPLDPAELVAEINAKLYPLLLGHDPGKPLGKVLAAKLFENATGEIFVAALLGFYENGPKLRFGDLGLNVAADVPSPTSLPALPIDLRLQLAADPKEISAALLDELVHDAPIPIDFQERSNNAAEASHTFVVVSIMLVTLVWNPFVTTFATEAAKDVYAAVRAWLKRLTERLAKHTNPVFELQSFHKDCRVSFMLRGQDIARHYRAHEALSAAAVRAAHLVEQMRAACLSPVLLIYEFHPTDDLWYPSYAELADGRLISDNTALVAAENLPSGLSLGLNLHTRR